MSNPLSFIAIELFGQGLRISNGKQLLASSPSFALIEADNITSRSGSRTTGTLKA